MNADPFLRLVNGPVRRRRPASDTADSMQRDHNGAVLPTLANALVILAEDVDLAGMLAFDQFGERLLIGRPPPPAREGDAPLAGPYPRSWRPEDVALIQAHLQRRWSHKFSRQTVEDAMPVEAVRNGFHPVRQYLAGLRHDGTARLGTWLTAAFGCPVDAYHAAAGAKMLIASVKRIRHPGVKFDHVPVFEGPQGRGKSTGLRRLYGDDWFSDALPDDLAGKDAAMALNGVWCLEMAELQQLIRTEPATVKAFLTRQVDRYRPPYGKTYIDRPRQTVLCGTTNDREWLSDTTGNRRFWPLTAGHVDPGWISEHRDQLWAEAAAQEAAGTSWWLDDDESRAGAAEAQESRLLDDAWGDKVRAYCQDIGRIELTSSALLDHIGLPVGQQNRSAQMRVSAILRDAGWTKVHTRRGKVWVRETDPPGGGSHRDHP